MSDQPTAEQDLVAALGALADPPKEGKVAAGQRRYTYLTLVDLLGAVRPVFAAHNLAVTQDVETRERGVSIVTVIRHASGQTFESSALVLTCQQDPQSIGSAITYGRRYSLGAFVGLAGEDDDGQAATKRAAQADEYQQTRPVTRATKRADDPQDAPYQTPPTPPAVLRTPPDPVEPGEMGDLGTPSYTNPAQEGHRRKLWAMLSSAGMREDNQRRAWVGAFLAIEPGWHWDQLTSAQVSAAIERLKTEPVDVGPDRPRR